MSIKDKFHITYVQDERYPDKKLIKLDRPVKELFDALDVFEFDFKERAQSAGIVIDEPILASEQDVKDYIASCEEYKKLSGGPKNYLKEEYLRNLLFVLSDLEYFEWVGIGAETDKDGLLDSNDKETVPPIFDSCQSCFHISECNSLAIVELAGKYYLTPRDNSGKLINDQQPYDEIARSSYFGWVKKDGLYGLVDIKTGETLIPCEMDSIEETGVGLKVIARKGDETKEYNFTSNRFVEGAFIGKTESQIYR